MTHPPLLLNQSWEHCPELHHWPPEAGMSPREHHKANAAAHEGQHLMRAPLHYRGSSYWRERRVNCHPQDQKEVFPNLSLNRLRCPTGTCGLTECQGSSKLPKWLEDSICYLVRLCLKTIKTNKNRPAKQKGPNKAKIINK